MEGAEIGSVAKGRVQDTQKSEANHPDGFKESEAKMINTLATELQQK